MKYLFEEKGSPTAHAAKSVVILRFNKLEKKHLGISIGKAKNGSTVYDPHISKTLANLTRKYPVYSGSFISLCKIEVVDTKGIK